jgi:hypothetical protein
MNGYIRRGILTFIVMVINAIVVKAAMVAAPIITGESATLQLNNSNADYFTAQLGMNFTKLIPIIGFFSLVVIALIWLAPLKALFKKMGEKPVAAILLATILAATPAFAYYDVKDRPEYIEIQPNQSAFLIPLTGANKTSQQKFMSESYLIDNKVAAKRIQIPHVQVESGVATERNKFVPSAKLIIVDRTPYNREWVKSTTKGSAATDQSISFESAESVEGYTGIAISAFVKEEDAAKFLYFFGTSGTVNPADPNSNFASVANGKSLAEVMDNNVRMKIQSLVAREFGKRTTIDGIKQKAEIMTIVEQEVKATFASKGITIDFMGYAEGLTFSKEVQASLDQIFISSLDNQTYPIRLKMMDIKKQEADIRLKDSTGAAMQKWNGSIPQWLMLPKELWEAIINFFKGTPAVAHK